MLRVKPLLTLFALTILAAARSGDTTAQESKLSRPATVADAAGVIDLESFPIISGGKSGSPRRLADLSYIAKGDPRGAYAFQKKTLEDRGWKELPGGYMSDLACSGAFGKNGFTLSVSANPQSGPGAAGLVAVMLKNHGNVDMNKLPVPADAKPLYSFPTVTAYVTEKSVKETSEALRSLLTSQGWEPYGTAGDSLFFKKNAIRITAWPTAAPAQGNKTMIQLSSELLSADLPAPPDPIRASYADTTKALSLDVNMTVDQLAAFYREALGKAGWKPTTDAPVTIDFDKMMIFRNEAKDIAILKMHIVDGKLRANLKHQTAAEFAEEIKTAEAEEAKRKAESAEYKAKMAVNKAVAVAIAVPTGAKDVVRKKDRIEFKLAPGNAKAAVQTIRAGLIKKGWNENAASLNPLAGTVVLSKKPGSSLTIVYVDTGLNDAEVTISSFDVAFDKAEAK